MLVREGHIRNGGRGRDIYTAKGPERWRWGSKFKINLESHIGPRRQR